MFSENSIWNSQKYNKLIEYLNSNIDNDYKEFNQKLIFTKYKILGIRVPILRKIAKKISHTDIISFLDIVKNDSYEEVLLEGIVISYIKDFDVSIKYFNKFIRKIDNWALCDIAVSSMKIVNNYKDKYFLQIKNFLQAKDEFIVRVGIVLLLNYYIDLNYLDIIFLLIDNINREDYYINIAIAWLVSICFIKYRDKTYKYLKHNNLNKFTYNKSIQKIIESYRVSKEDKELLRKMKK